ncbi:uncharacterized protein LOC120351802 isoform X2 [Nilaparvata lugens]|uniref:uncharacterized protein LOC120351802 isoform X2 n=1 Tax=Nilaparvata lugens TaxID=108931 RepID=UPI00193E7733|nr:uncharacterized protein LOC120351802 isoform X2 [Nilaparvata lugens]
MHSAFPGPRVIIPTNVVKFDGKLLHEVQKKTFFIENCSNVVTNFMFDCNGVDCVKFTPDFGLLQPFQKLRIITSYANKLRGQKFHQFMCLIEHHILERIKCSGFIKSMIRFRLLKQ